MSSGNGQQHANGRQLLELVGKNAEHAGDEAGIEHRMHSFAIVGRFFAQLPDLVLFADFIVVGQCSTPQRNLGAR